MLTHLSSRAEVWNAWTFTPVSTKRRGIRPSLQIVVLRIMTPCGPVGTATVVYWSEFLAADPEVQVRFATTLSKK
jgi:hypothetical protein